MSEVVILPFVDLLPDAWRSFAADGPVRAFNPGLLRDGDGWLLAYRLVGGDGLRRVGLCRLDAALKVVAGSPVAFSDRVRFAAGRDYAGPATTWFADPRLYRFAGRTFLYWNSGWHEPRNYQFLQEFDAADLTPIGHPRELLLRGDRQRLEKNWTFFGGEDLYAVYSAMPHRILEFSLAGTDDIEFTDTYTHAWDNENYSDAHGALRGGAPPQLADGHYWSFCHSVQGMDGDYRYSPAVYRFAGSPPFAPTGAPRAPLFAAMPREARRAFPKLNPAVGDVVYPCGAAFHNGRWLVSLGLNDEHCAIVTLPHSEVAAALRPLGGERLKD